MKKNDNIWEKQGDLLVSGLAKSYGYNFVVSLRGMGSFDFKRCQRDGLGDSFAPYFTDGSPFVFGEQVHKNHIELITKSLAVKDYYSQTDGFVIFDPLAVAGVFTADCLSVAIIDKKKRGFALVHSGWRGTEQKIVIRAVNMLLREIDSLSDLYVIFGPSIQKCCYEVGEEFKELFPNRIVYEDRKLMFDNQGAILDDLLNMGMASGNIFLNSYCTYCNNDLLYSYRLEGKDAGRNISLLGLNKLAE